MNDTRQAESVIVARLLRDMQHGETGAMSVLVDDMGVVPAHFRDPLMSQFYGAAVSVYGAAAPSATPPALSNVFAVMEERGTDAGGIAKLQDVARVSYNISVPDVTQPARRLIGAALLDVAADGWHAFQQQADASKAEQSIAGFAEYLLAAAERQGAQTSRADLVLREFWARGFEPPTSTGIRALDRAVAPDNKLGGFQKGYVWVIGAPSGHGKCFGKGERILMFDGSVKCVEDIVVGDKLMGPDSRPRIVTNLMRGHGQLWTVQAAHCRPYVVNSEHVLALIDSTTGNTVNLPVLVYQYQANWSRRILKGYHTAVDWPETKLPIEPYMLGIWIGDGTTAKPDITTMEPEIVGYLNDYAERHGLKVRKHTKPSNKASTYGFSGAHDDSGRRRPNSLLAGLRSLGLLGNKYGIPRCYLCNSRKNRMELLAGIIDTDGTYNAKYAYNGITICTKEKGLARDYAFLARSLGFNSSITEKPMTIKEGDNRIYYNVLVNGPLYLIPTRTARKQAVAYDPNRNPLYHTILSIKECRWDDYYGFSVEGPDQLFLLDDLTVTHNSSCAVHFVAEQVRQNNGVVLHSFEMPRERLLLRMLCNLACVPMSAAQNPASATEEEYDAIQRAVEQMGGLVRIYDKQCDLAELAQRIRRHRIEFGKEGLLHVIDHFGHIDIGTDWRDSRKAIYELVEMTKRHSICLVVFSQVSTETQKQLEAKNRVEGGGKLYGTTAPYQAADVLLYMCRHNGLNDGGNYELNRFRDVTCIQVEKVRDRGLQVAYIMLRYNPLHYCYGEEVK